jgi:hypothetical protein
MIVEIPIMDDFGMPDEGDQRVPNVAYNPDKNEFFVVWEVKKLSLDEPGIIGSGLVGRFINADGTFAGPAFTVVDEPRIQHWPSLVYVQDEQKYFISWTDSRDDGLPPGDPWYFSQKMDIYASWFDDTGLPLGDEIALCDCEGMQTSGVVAYNPAEKRFLVTWYDRHAPNDWSIVNPNPSDPFGEIPSDVRATLYGMPPDSDGDGVSDPSDNCPATPNPNQQNSDNDSHGDACDNCPLVDNEDQADSNGNGIGDACDTGGAPIPTLSEWGMIIFMMIMLGIGVVTILRRRMV